MTTLRRHLEANPVLCTTAQLRTYFHNACKPRASQQVGCEFEWIIVNATGQPVSYQSTRGAKGIFQFLRDRLGWEPRKVDGEWLLLRKGDMTIGLEPGGQIEYSSSPFPALGPLLEEYVDVRSQCRLAATECRAHLMAIGVHPTLTGLDRIRWVPKARYRALADRLRVTGSLGHWMMKGTASIQVNLDYADEKEFSDLMRAAAALAPMGKALFANSPIWKRRVPGCRSFRSVIWQDTDPDRCGIPPFMTKGRVSFDHYIQYALDVPALFCGTCPPGSHIQTFRRWMQSAAPHPPRLSDWDLHLTSLYPDVRAKPHIEVRYVDALPDPYAAATVAFFTGLLGTEHGRHVVLTHRARLAETVSACYDTGRLGKKAVDLSMLLVQAATDGLKDSVPDPELSLAPLRDLWTGRRCTVAELTLVSWNSAGSDAAFAARLSA